MPPVLNPAPGRRGRIRFRCTSKAGGSRGYPLAVDQLGLDPSSAAPPGWRQMESAGAVSVGRTESVRLMPVGRRDFQGWGGLEVTGSDREPAGVQLIQPTALARTHAIEVRGLVVAGAWAAAIDGGDETELAVTGKEATPCAWRLPVAGPGAGPWTRTLGLRCSAVKGRLLLDAWRPVAVGEEEDREE